MKTAAAFLGMAALTAIVDSAAAQSVGRAGKGEAPQGPLNTLIDIRDALRGCWKWPPMEEVRAGMELTVRLSFKRNGEIFGARLTYQSPNVSAEERALYHGVLLDALRLCSPLPVTESLGHAIAGRPMHFHFIDTRRQGKA